MKKKYKKLSKHINIALCSTINEKIVFCKM